MMLLFSLLRNPPVPYDLVIGTVTTGAPGSNADASITGALPHQTLNLTIPTGSQGPAGIQGPSGADGVNGIDGVDGEPGGPPGPAGADGEDGAAGVRGSIWMTGDGSPSGTAMLPGDMYLDRLTGDVYRWL